MAATLSLAELEIGDEIGHGAFSHVFRGRYRGADCAIKKIVVPQADLNRHLVSEIALLNSAVMEHPNLIKYFGVAIEPAASPAAHNLASKEVYIVTEFMDGGDLRSLLRASDTSLPWALRVRIARDIARALVQLHAAEVVHRDIKTENVLVRIGNAAWEGCVVEKTERRVHSVSSLGASRFCDVESARACVQIVGAGRPGGTYLWCTTTGSDTIRRTYPLPAQLDNAWRCVLADYGFARKAQIGVATAMTLLGEYFLLEYVCVGRALEHRCAASFGDIVYLLAI